MTAITDGNIEVVKSLLNPENINKEGITKSGRLTPLYHSMMKFKNNPNDERSSIIDLLIKNGAKLNIIESDHIYRVYKMNHYRNEELKRILFYYFDTQENKHEVDEFFERNADTFGRGSMIGMAAGGGGAAGDDDAGTSGSADDAERKIPKPDMQGGKRLKKKKHRSKRSKRSKRIKKKSKRIKRKSKKSRKNF